MVTLLIITFLYTATMGLKNKNQDVIEVWNFSFNSRGITIVLSLLLRNYGRSYTNETNQCRADDLGQLGKNKVRKRKAGQDTQKHTHTHTHT